MKAYYDESVKIMSFDEFVKLHENQRHYAHMTDEKRSEALKAEFLKAGGSFESKKVLRRKIENQIEEKAEE